MRRHCAQCSLSDSVVNASNASFVGEPECIQDDVARLVVDHEREFRIGLDTGGSPGARSGSGVAGVVSCLRQGLLSGGLPVAA